MSRRTRHIVVIGIAVVTASAASLGVYAAVTRLPARAAEPAPHFVVVAARSLPSGARLTASDLKTIPWPAGNAVAGTMSNLEAAVNRSLLASVVENEPLIDTKLAARGAASGLPSVIPAGMRAMSVRVNEVIGVAGFVDAGTRVDVVVTIRKKDDTTSRTVVSNVEVLTAGTRADREKPVGVNLMTAPTAPAVVTLLVTPKDAERIALAQTEGQIMLVLRNPLDNDLTDTSGVRSAGLFQPEPAEIKPEIKKVVVPRKAPVVEPPPQPPARNYTVEAIRAAKRTEEEVK
jgi:pilus assembly protein CpaB